MIRRWIVPVAILAFIAGICFAGGCLLVQDMTQRGNYAASESSVA
ncbi:MAG TPA: peptidase S1, partial [Desulfotomaculum sp.]|nr:peptidase S1 [Desulfotomaculum sp.]